MRHRERRAGTASVEIVVMLPVFVLLFLGAFYVHRTAQGHLMARARARGCAMQFAMDGCRVTGHDVDLCADATAESGADIAQGELGDAQSMLDQVRHIPVLGTAVRALFGEVAAAHATVKSVPLSGSEASDDLESHVGHLYLVCNTQPKNWDGIANFLCSLAATALPSVEVPGC